MKKFITKSDYLFVVAISIVAIILGVLIGYFIFGPINTYGALANYEHENYVDQQEIQQEIQPVYVRDYTIEETDYSPTILPPYRYVVTSQNGYIIILHAAPEGKASQVKNVTNIPTTPLPLEEQERLENGINIYDEDALVRILEDFGS